MYKDIITDDFSYDDILYNLEKVKNFSFSRFGDGEWNCIAGKKGHNCDGHPYTEQLQSEIRSCLVSAQYHMGLQRLAYTQRESMIRNYTTNNRITWCRADILHKASIKGRLHLFTEAIKNRNVVMVAPERLKGLIEYKTFWEIPLLNCFSEFDTMKNRLMMSEKDDVIIYCASMMANPLIHYVHKMYGDTITQIDCGSVFDPYMGFESRGYHKNLKNAGI